MAILTRARTLLDPAKLCNEIPFDTLNMPIFGARVAESMDTTHSKTVAEVEQVNVTRTFLPPLKDYEAALARIWANGWLTNNGPEVQGLERRLREYLSAPHLLALNNGTIALQLAIKALGVKNEVIVTPFSYVATVSSAVWEGCTPCFADILADDLTIDPDAVERAITPRTTAIMATHVFGNPCDVEALEAIAKQHGLKVIYDGAHAFGVEYLGKAITAFGDVTTLSFHATKLFHTVEGGAVVANDPQVAEKLAYMRNFGHKGPEAFQGLGINGKMSEVHAAMGGLVLDHIDHILDSRSAACIAYSSQLESIPGVRMVTGRKGTRSNHAYMPVLFETEADLLRVMAALKLQNIHPRRYFHPSLDTLPYVSGECPVSRSASDRILCLPLFAGMEIDLVVRITRIIRKAL